jgi:Uma2 family endonuclease
MMALRRGRLLTPQQYLARERRSQTKSEYLDGEVFAMTGASERHNLIAGNTFASLHAQVKARPCNVYPSDMRVKVVATGLYTYPDIAAVCGAIELEDESRDTLLNPTVIIEMLSRSTAAYDRGDKFGHYRKIPSLLEYVLISQDKCLVEHYQRQPNDRWLLAEANSQQAVVELPAIGCRLALADVYEKVIVAVK